jgi:putative FmdB family regulatory protein
VLEIHFSPEVHVPTYSYACTECDNRFDAVQAFTEDALTTCPKCSGRLRKLFNSVGVVFKGSGFYRNDSREAAKGSASSDSVSPSASDKANSGKSDSTKSDSPKSDSPKSDSPKSDSPKSDSTKSGSAPAATSSGTSASRGPTPAATGG